MRVLGIDVGGSGIKGAPVDTASGKLLAERKRIKTPDPATPQAVARTVAEIARHFDWDGPIGCAMPAVVKRGRLRTAANISRSWLGVNAAALLHKHTGCPVSVINDADAAGYAEMHFGAGRNHEGLVIMITLGTGIGTALFINGHLVPNTELGHLTLRGRDAETWAAESVREKKDLGWKKWARRLDVYLRLLQGYFWPDAFIIGGGVSKKWQKFLPHLKLITPVVPARLRNEAGIIGAALAYDHERRHARQKRSLG
ncbi:MAG TPA: ROK family protein [Burkholderiales bacterium]|nr:ROK family protein [Burkholderiales bacterium]